MKKVLIASMAVLFTLLITTAFTISPDKKEKKFKGIITYDITYSGDIDAATLAQQPKDMIVKILGNKSRQEYAGASVINDGDAKTTIVLLDVAGNKYALRSTKEDIEKKLQESPAPTIKYIDGETKIVAGFTCKKAELTEIDQDTEEEVVTTIFYTEAFGSEIMNYGGQFHGLKGWPLEYEMTVADITIKYTARSVNRKGKVAVTDFLIPEDYKVTSREKLMEIFTGGMED